jgi:hypothetical protein
MEQPKSYPLGQPIPNPTIKVVTSETIHSPAYSDQVTISVIRYDGHEYIANSKGGIIHSESCPCKAKERKEEKSVYQQMMNSVN